MRGKESLKRRQEGREVQHNGGGMEEGRYVGENTRRGVEHVG